MSERDFLVSLSRSVPLAVVGWSASNCAADRMDNQVICVFNEVKQIKIVN